MVLATIGPMISTSFHLRQRPAGLQSSSVAADDASARPADSMSIRPIVAGARPYGRTAASRTQGAVAQATSVSGSGGCATALPRGRAREVRISATAATIMSPAMAVSPVTCSPSTIAPSATATSGFTYAYVETAVADTWCSSQMYAEYAISEPNTIR